MAANVLILWNSKLQHNKKKCSVQYGEQGICSKLHSKLDAEAIDFVSIEALVPI